MKKNKSLKIRKKGFTLVELLAVIVILAIVVGIAIPGINGLIQGAKSSALGTVVEAAADFLQTQYAMFEIDRSSIEPAFTNVPDLHNMNISLASLDHNHHNSNESKLLDAMGLTKDKVQIVMLCVTKGKVVVSVIKIPKSSPYYTTENWKTDSTDPNYAVPNYESDIKENSIRGDAKPTWTNAEETEFHGCT